MFDGRETISRLVLSSPACLVVLVIVGGCGLPESSIPVTVEPVTIRLNEIEPAQGPADAASSSQPLVKWLGHGDVYRKAWVASAGQSLGFRVRVPDNAWLDLSTAVSRSPARMSVEIEPLEEPGERSRIAEQTVTEPNRWQPLPVGLESFGGQEVELSLVLEADEPSALGYWGGAVIRTRVPRDAPRPTPLGVILIVAETLRADHVSALGYERATTPELSRLAADGALARNCLAQATWTKVSVPSILTSLYPLTHGVREQTDKLPDAAETLAEVFLEAGYATVGLAAIPHVGQMTHLEQGFEEFHESGSFLSSGTSKSAREQIDRLLPWLEDHREVPFFALLHVADPHGPYEPYPPYDLQWGKQGDREAFEELAQKVEPFIEDPLLRDSGFPSRQELLAAGVDPERFVRYEIDGYDGSIRAMDDEIARLMGELEAMGLRDRVLLVFTGDHGEEFLDHGRHFHGHSVYGELARVPLIFWGPAWIPSGRVLERTVQSLDIVPTILELAQLPIPEAAQGRSLVAELRTGSSASTVSGTAAIVEKPMMLGRHRLPESDYRSVAIVEQGWKLIWRRPAPGARPEIELFDYRSDPLDQVDLAEQHPEVVERLRASLLEWEESAMSSRIAGDDVDRDPEIGPEIDAATRERLRALGYLAKE